MNIKELIKNKIAQRKMRKAKLNKIADMIDFCESDGCDYIVVDGGLIAKSMSTNGCGDIPPYLWKNKDGNIVVNGNLIIHGTVTECMSDTDHESVSAKCANKSLE